VVLHIGGSLLGEWNTEFSLYKKRNNKGNSIHTEEKSQPHRYTALLAFILLLCSFGAEIMENH